MPAKKSTKPKQASAQLKKWTIMVYMAGDNDLDPNGIKDLKEIKTVGSNNELNFIGQLDRMGGSGGSYRYYLRKGGSVTNDFVQDLGEINTGDPKTLSEFLAWGFKNYPAERYAVILWNHGAGWDDKDIYAGTRFRAMSRAGTGRIRHALFHKPVRQLLKQAIGDAQARAILFDDNAKDFLDNLEMKAVLAQAAKTLGRKIDLLGMDACLMSMAEVGYQIKDTSEITVGSEETEPADGWPYHMVLADLAKNPSMSARDLGKTIVDRYVASYSSDPVTQSACDLAKSDALAGAIQALAKAMSKELKKESFLNALIVARNRVQTYHVFDNIDLPHFCQLMEKSLPNTDVAARCRDVIQATSGGYVMASKWKGNEMKNSNGVAIYFPTSSVSPLYDRLDFPAKTGWADFLRAYLKAVSA